MPERRSKLPSLPEYYARLDRDVRSALKCSAITALREAREGKYRESQVYDILMGFSDQIDSMDRLLRGRIRKKTTSHR